MSTLSLLAQNFDQKTFGEMMATLRIRSGLSARALSLASGMSPAYVSKIERDTFLPTLDRFAVLITHLNVSDAEIVFLVRMLSLRHS